MSNTLQDSPLEPKPDRWTMVEADRLLIKFVTEHLGVNEYWTEGSQVVIPLKNCPDDVIYYITLRKGEELVRHPVKLDDFTEMRSICFLPPSLQPGHEDIFAQSMSLRHDNS